MAKKIDYEKQWTNRPAPLEAQPQWSSPASEEFLRSLEDKQDVAMRLSSELAAWFGDRSLHVPGV